MCDDDQHALCTSVKLSKTNNECKRKMNRNRMASLDKQKPETWMAILPWLLTDYEVLAHASTLSSISLSGK